MVVGVETYYAADVLVRDANTSNTWSTVAIVWLALSIGAGVSLGAAGALSTRTGTWTGAAASATLPAVFVSEAAHEGNYVRRCRLDRPPDRRCCGDDAVAAAAAGELDCSRAHDAMPRSMERRGRCGLPAVRLTFRRGDPRRGPDRQARPSLEWISVAVRSVVKGHSIARRVIVACTGQPTRVRPYCCAT